MQGKSHIGFALAGGVTIINGLYFMFPHSLPGGIDPILHPVGILWTAERILLFWQTHQLLESGSFVTFAQTIIFFVFLFWCARLPDALEGRPSKGRQVGLSVKHRGFTHSFFILFILVLAFSFLYISTFGILQQAHLTLLIDVMSSAFLGLFCAWLLHIVADCLTTRGVRVWWPDSTYHALLPRSLRFSNGDWQEYVVLWGFIGVTCALVMLGKWGV